MKKKKMKKKKIEKIEFRCNTCNEPLADITATKTHVCMGNKVKWSGLRTGRRKILWH